PGAALGARTVIVTTGNETVQLSNGFTVLSGKPVINSTPVLKTKLGALPFSTQPADLTNWTVHQYIYPQSDGPANWVRQAGNTVVTQSAGNPDGSIFLSDFDLSCSHIEGTLRVNTTFDDDEIGFVFGYQDPLHHYRFIWKKAFQSPAPQGMGINIVKAASTGEFAGENIESPGNHILFSNSIAWLSFTTYRYTLDFIPGQFKIAVYDGTILLDSVTISDNTYLNGKFGFYNNSQGLV